MDLFSDANSETPMTTEFANSIPMIETFSSLVDSEEGRPEAGVGAVQELLAHALDDHRRRFDPFAKRGVFDDLVEKLRIVRGELELPDLFETEQLAVVARKETEEPERGLAVLAAQLGWHHERRRRDVLPDELDERRRHEFALARP